MQTDPKPTGAFADLAAAAAAVESAPAPGITAATAAAPAAGEGSAASPAAAPGPDYDGDARDVVGFVVDGLVPVYPRLEAVYTAAVVERLSARLARVMEKYEWDLEFFGPELLLGMILVPVSVRTYTIIREDLKADKEAKGRAAPAAAAAPAPASAAAVVSAAPAAAPEPPAPSPSAVVLDPAAAQRVAGDPGANLFKKA